MTAIKLFEVGNKGRNSPCQLIAIEGQHIQLHEARQERGNDPSQNVSLEYQVCEPCES
jgi:hypothetical protein